MVRGRFDRFQRSVASTLAAVFSLALPWAFSGVPSAHATEEDKVETAPAKVEEKSAPEQKQTSAKKVLGEKKTEGAQAAHKKHKKKAKRRLASKETHPEKAKSHAAPARKEPHTDHDEPNVAVHHDKTKSNKASAHDKSPNKPAHLDTKAEKKSDKSDKKSGKGDTKSGKKSEKSEKSEKNEHSAVTLNKQENVSASLKTEKHEKTDKHDKQAKPVEPTVVEASHASVKKPETNARRSRRASAQKPGSGKRRMAKKDESEGKPPCFAPALAIDRNGIETDSFPLVDCKGHVLESAREKLSVLARPWGSPRPTLPSRKKSEQADLRITKDLKDKHTKKDKPHDALAKTSEAQQPDLEPGEIAPNVRLLDPGLLARIEAIHKHYPGKSLSLVSGYRPKSKGSLHQSARALDLRVVGVTNEDLVAFCKTLEDTGCGYYPNSSFVHIDVRNKGTGSVTWIDASGPGETPRYVTQWPPPPDEKPTEGVADEEPESTPGKPVPTAAKEAEKPTELLKEPAVQKEADPKDKNDTGTCAPSR